MSLINDALKKAQTLQTRPAGSTHVFPRANPASAPEPAVAAAAAPTATTPTPTVLKVSTATAASFANASKATTLATPLPAPAPAATPAPVELPPLRKGKSPHGGLIVAIASTVLIVALGAIGYVVYALFFMSTSAEPAASTTAPEVKVVQDTKPATPAPETSTTSPAVAAPQPSPAVSPAASIPTPTTVAAVDPSPSSATIATAPTSTAVTPAPAPEPAPVEEVIEERINNPKPHIQAWVDKINVAGIRGGDRPKALMNDRVFLVGEIVNRELGLRLFEVQDRLLVFEDQEGNTYEFTF